MVFLSAAIESYYLPTVPSGQRHLAIHTQTPATTHDCCASHMRTEAASKGPGSAGYIGGVVRTYGQHGRCKMFLVQLAWCVPADTSMFSTTDRGYQRLTVEAPPSTNPKQLKPSIEWAFFMHAEDLLRQLFPNERHRQYCLHLNNL